MSLPTVHSAQSTQHGRQWWARKQNSMSHRTPSTTVSETSHAPPQSLALDEKHQPCQLPSAAKPSMKFHTFASAMGFKSKKSSGHPSLDLNQQQVQMPQRLRVNTSRVVQPSASSGGRARAQTIDAPGKLAVPPVVVKSPTEMSIRTVQSSVDSPEPLTPADVPRSRISYQPSLFSYSEHDPLPDFICVEGGVSFSLDQDLRRASVMSDPSIIDPHMESELQNTFSRSTYYSNPTDAKKPYVHNSIPTEGLSPPSSSYGKPLNRYVFVSTRDRHLPLLLNN